MNDFLEGAATDNPSVEAVGRDPMETGRFSRVVELLGRGITLSLPSTPSPPLLGDNRFWTELRKMG